MIIHSALENLIQVLPDYIKDALKNHKNQSKLVEILIDLGRRPEGRFLYGSEYLSERIVGRQDIDYAIKQLGKFSNDNRAGIEQTLHRISCIRNRQGIIIGLTCRVGRCILGCTAMIRDLLEFNYSLLILGKPGVGKTTLIREISRIFSDEAQKRVVIIDTSNEIAGNSDIPHPGIGRARRMQVSGFENQHKVMIEAVENHMPEVIIVDEIGTELEAYAARTIAERGVQLIATAHGNSLESLIKNPTLSDLIGGIQYVTLSDEEARRRKTQKTVLERKFFPAFDVVIELNDKNLWTIHERITDSVDRLLQGQYTKLQIRTTINKRLIKIESTNMIFSRSSFLKPYDPSKQFLNSVKSTVKKFPLSQNKKIARVEKTAKYIHHENELNQEITKQIVIYSYHLCNKKINHICKSLSLINSSTKILKEADIILASKIYFNQNPRLQQLAKNYKIPVYLIKNNTGSQITNVLKYLMQKNILK